MHSVFQSVVVFIAIYLVSLQVLLHQKDLIHVVFCQYLVFQLFVGLVSFMMLLQAIFRFPKDRKREALHLGHLIKIYNVIWAGVLRGRGGYVVVKFLHCDKTLFLEGFPSVAHFSPYISSGVPNKPFVKCYPDLLNHSCVKSGILGY